MRVSDGHTSMFLALLDLSPSFLTLARAISQVLSSVLLLSLSLPLSLSVFPCLSERESLDMSKQCSCVQFKLCKPSDMNIKPNSAARGG